MVRLLAGKLVHVVARYSLGGSLANRPHTPSPTQGRYKNHMSEDTQATSNPLELPFAILLWGRNKHPSQPLRSKPTTITNSHSTIPQTLGRLGVGKHQK